MKEHSRLALLHSQVLGHVPICSEPKVWSAGRKLHKDWGI